MEAPVRIHAKVFGFTTQIPSGIRGLVGGWHETAYGGTEYIRADLVRDMASAIEDAKTVLTRHGLGEEIDLDYLAELIAQARGEQ